MYVYIYRGMYMYACMHAQTTINQMNACANTSTDRIPSFLSCIVALSDRALHAIFQFPATACAVSHSCDLYMPKTIQQDTNS